MTGAKKAVRSARKALSWLIIFLQGLHTLLFVICTFPIAWLDIKALMAPLLRYWAWVLFFLAGKRVHVKGRHHLDRSRNYLLVANHTSYYDAPGIMTVIPRVAWLGRSMLIRIPVLASFLRATHFIPVYRGDQIRSKRAIDDAIKEASQLTIAIFPEGTRTGHGGLNPFKKGFIHIMRGSNLDILPVTLNGFYRFMPRHGFVIDPRARLEIIIHPPISREALLEKTNDEIVDIVRGVIDSENRNVHA